MQAENICRQAEVRSLVLFFGAPTRFSCAADFVLDCAVPETLTTIQSGLVRAIGLEASGTSSSELRLQRLPPGAKR